MRMIVAAPAAALLLTGCETMTPQQREQLIAEGNREITCTAGADCEAKWARVTQWIQANSHWKFRNVTETLISTEGPFDTTYAAFEVTKVPFGDGTTYRLLLRGGCGNIFGCVPSIPQLRASFTQFVLGDSRSATANPTERAYIRIQLTQELHDLVPTRTRTVL